MDTPKLTIIASIKFRALLTTQECLHASASFIVQAKHQPSSGHYGAVVHQPKHVRVPSLQCAPCCVQDFFQVLKPGLQLLRPPKKDAKDGAGIVAGFVGYNYDAFKQEFGIEPWQVIFLP